MGKEFVGYRDNNGDYWEYQGNDQYLKDGWRIESARSLMNKYGPLKAVYN